MNIADVLFWLVALAQISVAVRCLLLIHSVPPRHYKSGNFFLARGQFQDGWVSAAAMWAIFLSKDSPVIRSVLDVAGAAVLLWLLGRTLQRLRRLRRGE